ncbi:MAG TPA: acyl carrier protein [Polyangiales bacterium]
MNEQQVFGHIQRLLAELAENKGASLPAINGGTQLLGGDLPIDSLDLATLVRELEEATGHDPFRDGFIDFKTVGELARLYVK